MIEAILFDLDETLHRRAPSVERFARQLHRNYMPDVHETTFVDELMRLDEHGYRPTEQLFRDVIAAFRLPVTATRLTEQFRQTAWRAPVLFDDALPTLSRLRSRGYRLGIITNGSGESQTAKLANSGLADAVDACLISGTVGVKKPDERIFRMMSDALGVAPAKCVMVGDNLALDVDGAIAAGMAAIWMAPGQQTDAIPEGCLARIEAIAEVPDVVSEPRGSSGNRA